VPQYQEIPRCGFIGEEDHAQVATYLSELAQESRDARAPREPMAEACLNLWTYGVEDPDSLAANQIVVQRIQGTIAAICQIQLDEAPTATLEPVETGEPPEYYWAGGGVGSTRIALAPPELGGLGLMPEEVGEWVDDNGETQSPLPLDEQLGEFLTATAAPAEVAPLLGPGQVRPHWIVEFNDRLVADVYQTVLKVFWQRSQIDLTVRQVLTDTNIVGWQWVLYEYDDAARRHKLTQVPVKQVHCDPTARDIADAAFAGVDIPMDLSAARACYPHLTDVLEAEAVTGYPNRPDASTTFSSQFDRSFNRPMVTLRIMWLRNQVVPMGSDEALALGLVLHVPTPMEPAPTPPDPSSVPVNRDAGIAATGDTPVPDGPAGGFTLPDGTPVEPGDPAWPTRLGVRQLTEIGGKIVDDRESPFGDIPLLLSVNIPLPAGPFGIGEPWRLKDLQAAESRTLDAMIKHVEFYGNPITTISQSMKALLGEDYKDARACPGLVLTVPDDLYERTGGKVEAIHDPPPLSAGHAQLFPMLGGLIDDISGNTEAIQGRMPSQAHSGRAIEMLQSAASGVIGFKAKRLADMLRRLTMFQLHALVWMVSEDEIAAVVGQYPRHIIRKVCERARRLEWNVTVNIDAGTGGGRMQKRALAAQDLQARAISVQTYQEEAGIDPRRERHRLMAEQQQAAQVAGAAATPAAEPQRR
jgi:hypothetical protein